MLRPHSFQPTTAAIARTTPAQTPPTIAATGTLTPELVLETAIVGTLMNVVVVDELSPGSVHIAAA